MGEIGGTSERFIRMVTFGVSAPLKALQKRLLFESEERGFSCEGTVEGE
jgi:hypothetical protein